MFISGARARSLVCQLFLYGRGYFWFREKGALSPRVRLTSYGDKAIVAYDLLYVEVWRVRLA